MNAKLGVIFWNACFNQRANAVWFTVFRCSTSAASFATLSAMRFSSASLAAAFGLLLLLPAVFLLQWLPTCHALRVQALLLLQLRVLLLLQFQLLIVAWPESLPSALIALREQYAFAPFRLWLMLSLVTLFIHKQSYLVV
ncbi:hypothetical protein M5G07_08745 [Serratia symbiotica]|nr:hypothetical protein [Serratia symbiotica]